MTETRIGKVTHYFNHLHVAGVTITDNKLQKGDKIGLKVIEHAREHDTVYMVT